MITSVGEYWFLALAFPTIIFIILTIFLRLLAKFHLLSQLKNKLAKLNNKAAIAYSVLMSFARLVALLPFVFSAYFSYLIFSSGISIDMIYPQNTGERYELSQGNGFIFDPMDSGGFFKLFPKINIGRKITEFLLQQSPDGISLTNLSNSLQIFNQSQENQRLIINQSDKLLYIQQHFYTEADIQPMARRKIPAHVMVAVPYGFFSPLYVGCKDQLPNRYASDGITLPANSFLLQITEKPSELC